MLKGNLKRLERDLGRDRKNNDRPPLKEFRKRIVSEFVSLRDSLQFIRELADGPLGEGQRDDRCIDVLEKMENLQTLGDDLTRCVEEAGTTEREYDKALEALGKLFPEIDGAGKMCKDVGKLD